MEGGDGRCREVIGVEVGVEIFGFYGLGFEGGIGGLGGVKDPEVSELVTSEDECFRGFGMETKRVDALESDFDPLYG